MIITAEVLLSILEKVPGDYEIVFDDGDIEHFVQDKVELDVSGKKIILKS